MVLEIVDLAAPPEDRGALRDVGRAAIERAREVPGFVDAWLAEDADGLVGSVLWESPAAVEASAPLRERALGLVRAMGGGPPAELRHRYLDVVFHARASER